MNTKFAIGAALALAMGFAATANAGLRSAYAVYVSQYGAQGQMHSARVSGNNKEFIGCTVMGNTYGSTPTYMACSASDATGKSFYCTKYNPSYVLIQAAASANESSSFLIQSNSSYECTYVLIQNSSNNL